jgi:hypothetical protein
VQSVKAFLTKVYRRLRRATFSIEWNAKSPIFAIAAEGICSIGIVERLEELTLAHLPLTDDVAKAISGLPHLRELELDTCFGITESGYKLWTSLVILQSLVMDRSVSPFGPCLPLFQLPHSSLQHFVNRLD